MATFQAWQRDSATYTSTGSTASGGVHHTRSRFRFWILLDILTVFVSAAIATSIEKRVSPVFDARAIYRGVLFHGTTLEILLALLVGFTIALVLVSRRHNLYHPTAITSFLHEQRMSAQSCITAALLLTGILYMVHTPDVPRHIIVLTVALVLVLLAVRRGIYRILLYRRFDRGIDLRSTLIVGSSPEARALCHHLQSIPHLGYHVKGVVPPSELEVRVVSESDNADSIDLLFQRARAEFVDEIIFATQCDHELMQDILERARDYGVDIRLVPDFYAAIPGVYPIEYIGQFPTVPLHSREVPEYSLIFKRMLDIWISASVMAILAPILAVIAIAIKFDSRGPVFYRSERIGMKGRVFGCFKFRTMVADAESLRDAVVHMNERDGVLFKIANDPRITRVGRLLRKYSLDELPQFFNVLKGDMSIVGPRPPLASEVKEYKLGHLRRLSVTPGITGLWQVQGRQDPSFDCYVSLDLSYIENWSLWLDIKIMIRTIGVVFAGTGM